MRRREFLTALGLDAGILTDEEFAAKKAEILKRFLGSDTYWSR
jgi:hypothetical protein